MTPPADVTIPRALDPSKQEIVDNMARLARVGWCDILRQGPALARMLHQMQISPATSARSPLPKRSMTGPPGRHAPPPTDAEVAQYERELATKAPVLH
jgi:hypothetical protein